MLISAIMTHAEPSPDTPDFAPSDAIHFTHSTTTNQHQSAKAEYSSGYPEKRRGDVVVLAERLAGQHSINCQTWHEACRIMCQKAAAVAVIATIQKFRTGAVDRPGAYLRGMSKRTTSGDPHLGRTFHGLKDSAAAAREIARLTAQAPAALGSISPEQA